LNFFNLNILSQFVPFSSPCVKYRKKMTFRMFYMNNEGVYRNFKILIFKKNVLSIKADDFVLGVNK
jgi:hypothetical protein